MKKITLIAMIFMACMVLYLQPAVKGQVPISAGTTITESFSIGTSATAPMPSGWKVDKNNTVRAVGTYSGASSATERIGGNNMSTSAGNGIYNYGAGPDATATDRAVGGLSSSSASKSVNVYVQLTNNGAGNIANFNISYDVEKYRRGSNGAGFTIKMYYSTDGSTWTEAGADFTSSFLNDSDNTGYASAPGDSIMVTNKLLNIPLSSGSSLYLAWNYSVTSGTTTSNAQALGIDDVSITANSSATVVATPVFSPSPGNYITAQSVSISTTTAGASIYYTTNGTDPDSTSTPFNPLNPIPVSTNTTIKAIAYKTGMTHSAIATGIYKFPVDVANIAALRAGALDGTMYRLTGEAVVTFTRPPTTGRNQKYIQDATGAIVIDDPSGVFTTTYVRGDGLTGMIGTLFNFSNLLEWVPVADPGAPSSTGNIVVPIVKTLAEITSADQAKLVSIAGVSFNSPTGNFASGTNYTISDASGGGNFYTTFAESNYIGDPIPSTPQNMVALVGQSGTAIRITPRDSLDMTNASTPALSLVPAALSGFTYITGNGPSPSQSTVLSGVNLNPASGSVTASGSTHFQVSTNNSTFGSSAVFSYSGGTLPDTNLYVRLVAGLGQGTYTDTLTISGGSAPSKTLICTGTVDPAPTVYTWQGPNRGSWATPGNWNPTRTTPAINDLLHFNDGTAKIITGVTTQTIGQLILANNTSVTLRGTSTATLTIRGEAGPDLVVPAGCSLNTDTIGAITLAVATGATGQIDGQMTLASSGATTAHKLTAADPSGITFNSGAVFTFGPGTTSNPFGTTSLNSVIFGNGSTYVHKSGSNPFGASAPSSVVIFQSGSLFKYMTSGGPSIGNRVYANFEYDYNGTSTNTGTSVFTMDNVTVTQGTFSLNLTGGANLKGNIFVNTNATLNFTPGSAGTFTFNGTSGQTITNHGNLNFGSFSTIVVDNAAGITLMSPVKFQGGLNLVNGLVHTGLNSVTFGSAATIGGSPSVTAMIVPEGATVYKEFSTSGSTGIFTFPIGKNPTSPAYLPVTLNLSGATFATGNHAGITMTGQKYEPASSSADYLNRYWSLALKGITGYTCHATFKYADSDIQGTESLIRSTRVIPVPAFAFGAVDPAQNLLSVSGLNTDTLFVITGTRPAPVAVTTIAGNVDATVATLNGTVNANYTDADVLFHYWSATQDTVAVPAVPAQVTGGETNTPVSADLTGLTPETHYSYRVVASNALGTAYGDVQSFLTTCLLPGEPGAINGAQTVCANLSEEIFTIDPIDNVTYYIWSFPSGATIIDGDGTNTVTVMFEPGAESGDVTVYGTNNCGNESEVASFSFTVNDPVEVSVSINASANPVPAGTSVTFSATPVNGGAMPDFQWFVNNNLMASGGSSFAYTPVNNDEVFCLLTSSETCTVDNPVASTSIIMTVTGIPENLNVSGVVGSGQSECYNASSIIYVSGSSTTFEVLSGGSATFIAGQRIFFLPGTTVHSNSYVHGFISTTERCNPPAPEFKLAGQGMEVNSGDFRFMVYPNPTSGLFTIESAGGNTLTGVHVDITNMMGSKIASAEASDLQKQEFSLAGNPAGIYLVRITRGDQSQIIKILLTR